MTPREEPAHAARDARDRAGHEQTPSAASPPAPTAPAARARGARAPATAIPLAGASRSRASRAVCRTFGGAEHPPAVAERLREHLLLGGREVDAALAAQLPLRRRSTPAAWSASTSRRSACGCRRPSAKLFGFSPLSLLLPGGDRGRAGGGAAVPAARSGASAPWRRSRAALALAVFPSFVAVSRDNGVDPLLILLLVMACCAPGCARPRPGAGARCSCAACWSDWPSTRRRSPPISSSRRSRSPTWSAPRLARALASEAAPRRGGDARGLVRVDRRSSNSRQPSKRPYVGSSTNNTELGLTFEYNGFGRVEGQAGGPGHVPAVPARGFCPPAGRPRRRPAAPVGRSLTGAAAPNPRRAATRAALSLPARRQVPQPDPVRRCARPAAAVRQAASATRPAGCCRSRSFGLLALLVLALAERARPPMRVTAPPRPARTA